MAWLTSTFAIQMAVSAAVTFLVAGWVARRAAARLLREERRRRRRRYQLQAETLAEANYRELLLRGGTRYRHLILVPDDA